MHHRGILRPFPPTLLAVLLVLGLLPLGSASSLAAAEGKEPEAVELALNDWLVLGPVDVPLPAFSEKKAKDGAEEDKDSGGVAELLGQRDLDLKKLWPAAGDTVDWPGAAALTWRRLSSSEGGELDLGTGGEHPRVAYLATYVETSSFVETKVEVSSAHRLRLFLDGEKRGEKKKVDAGEEDSPAQKRKKKKAGKGTEAESSEGSAKADLPLATGKHLLLVRAIWDPSGPAAWSISTRLKHPAAAADARLETGTDARRGLRLADVLDVETASDVALSADGGLVAVQLRYPATPADFGRSWTELRETDSGRLVRTLRAGASSLDWAPAGRGYAYVVRDKGKASLWIANLDSGKEHAVLEDVEHLGGFQWAPDSKSLFFTVNQPDEKEDKEGLKRFRGLNDRWPGWRQRSSIYQVSVKDGVRRRLTAGEEALALQDVSPDGERILCAINRHEMNRRPFTFDDLYEIDLTSLERTKLRTVAWFGGAQYTPDGERILVFAGPSAFDGAGVATAEGVVPNEYDTQAYLLHRTTPEVEAVTRNFDPALLDGAWSADDRFYVRVQEGSRVRLAVLEGDGSFRLLPSPVDVISRFTVSRDGSRLAYIGSSADAPPRVLTSRPGGEAKEIYRPSAEVYERVDIGRVESFDVEVEGTKIVGRVHYPADFDASREYPLIVYYYGGTVPHDRSFGGRYPKNVWTANGYVVYVPQPSGATGFGQEFSARHVNDWGETTSKEIVAGARKLIAQSPFLDAGRVGCTGASYGGFMTMYLLTQTDLCSAGVAHAGISALSSYWGEGWWGYLYSAVASANSYPWNNRELYVDHSPLFNADSVEAPLLLLHGDSDTNVPLGESVQFYAALQVLGKEAELITFDDENHRVVSYPRRLLWSQSIIAWFDRHLKGESGFWDHLFPSD